MINTVAIVGATHGNEWSGIQLVKNWQTYGVPYKDADLKINCYLANQAAIDSNIRFIDEDLNRQFSLDNLQLNSPASREGQLAQTINTDLGPKGNSKTDLVIDVHNTTSNMGPTLIILEADEFNIGLARYVKQAMPESNILVEDEKPYLEHHYLCTTGKKGVMIEVGAQPQGLLRADVYLSTEKMALAILEYVTQFNNKLLSNLPSCEAFRFGENICFPMNDHGERVAMIHPDLQDKDFEPLGPGEPMFLGFDGSSLGWSGDDVIFPHFINEAAYHKQNVAFATAIRFML